MISETQLIERKDIRDTYINRIDILDRVKTLFVLPDIFLATRQQVADYYEVDESTIRKVEQKYRDEIDTDGFKVFKLKDFKERTDFPNLKITSGKGLFEIEFSNKEKKKFPHAGIILYTRRAILRVGMLLRDSEVAKEVRTQLLNIEEKSTTEQKISSITEEQQLILNIVYANDASERAIALNKYNTYKNRYIDSLEQKVDALTDGILRWESRDGVNRMARLIACKKYNGNFAKAYNRIETQLLYKYDISINGRKAKSKLKKPTLFDVIQPSEMPMLVQACLALCQMYKINTDELLLKK